MSDDKKFSLDELPDEGSKPEPQVVPRKLLKKDKPEPRIERLKTLDDRSKIEMMVQSWSFDKREPNHGWICFVVVLGIVEFTPFYQTYLSEIDAMNKNFFDVGGDMVRNMTSVLEAFIRHPIILVLLTPIFFKFSHASDYNFRISFDGIDTVKRLLPVGSTDLVTRTFIKWKEITKVEKGKIGDKEILRLHSTDGHIADLIWYIDLDKKRAIKLLLNGMILPKHPMREFLEKEKELK